MIISQGAIKVVVIFEAGGISNGKDCLCWKITTMQPAVLSLSSSIEDDIVINLRPVGFPHEKPTSIKTELKWKTFDDDDNINIMQKGQNTSQNTILISKKFGKLLYASP